MINFSRKTSQTYKDNMRKYKRNMIVGAGLIGASVGTTLLLRRKKNISTLKTPSTTKTISTPSYGKASSTAPKYINNTKDLDEYMLK